MTDTIDCKVCEDEIMKYRLEMGKIIVVDSEDDEYFENGDGEHVCKDCYYGFTQVGIQ